MGLGFPRPGVNCFTPSIFGTAKGCNLVVFHVLYKLRLVMIQCKWLL